MPRSLAYQMALLAVGTSALLATGCSSKSAAPDAGATDAAAVADAAPTQLAVIEFNRDIDILFVIDNSLSMDQEQDSLLDNFPLLIQVLESIEGGLPNVHIGVVSSDVGTGPPLTNEGGPCSIAGDEGRLQVEPRIAGCVPPTDAFIEDVEDPANPGTRSRNYTGSLGETFQCIAALGTAGCGFEQHLESMRQALNGSQPSNAGFLRDDAYLAVIIVADEDDCSAADDGLFDPRQDSVDDPLGALESFRCFEFGVKCDGDTDLASERAFGPRTNCVPDPDSRYLHEVEEYVSFLKSLKADPSRVIVAGIIGNANPVQVGPDDDNPEDPAVLPSCESGAGEAAPGIRLKAFLDGFPQRNTFTTICNENLSDALLVIAELLKGVVSRSCIGVDLADTNPALAGLQAECEVAEVVPSGAEAVIAACNADLSNKPCWRLEEDAVCTGASNLAMTIERDLPAEPGIRVEARCVTIAP